MNRKKASNRKGSGVLILLLVFLILVTFLFILQEVKEKKPQIKTYKPGKEEILQETEEKLIQKPSFKKAVRGAKIALILDDAGWNPDVITWVKKIKVPLTLAILPESPFGLQIAKQIASLENTEAILHIPLEPENTRDETKASQEYLTTKMTNEEIVEKLEQYMKKFESYVCGVNHHMGSRFTANKEKMEVFLQKIKERNLLYIDSLTTSNSTGYTLARQMGIPAARRDIFIDNPAEYGEIIKTLDAAAKIAEKKGMVIAIGHVRTTTLKALNDKVPELERRGFQFIPVTQAVQ
ncbi:MAG: divergent polysaccharide deacetylase family protein [Candidatus Omnitrophica bacterium]|nr:divergent polysaccharide deacetylase family protein [Candidatus Omnitrophota bacterium]